MNIYDRGCSAKRWIYLMISMMVYILTLGGVLMRKRTHCLCYHGIPAEDATAFLWQVDHVAGLHRQAKSNHQIVFTFDDAFENILSFALPPLMANGIPTIVFAVTSCLGAVPTWEIPLESVGSGEQTMSPAHLIEADRHQGLIIGSHTHTHRKLTDLNATEIHDELQSSKDSLERLLKRPVLHLALPHGAGNDDVSRIASECGYRSVYTLNAANSRRMEEFLVPRFSMSPRAKKIEFYLTCRGAYGWLHSLRNRIHGLRS